MYALSAIRTPDHKAYTQDLISRYIEVEVSLSRCMYKARCVGLLTDAAETSDISFLARDEMGVMI